MNFKQMRNGGLYICVCICMYTYIYVHEIVRIEIVRDYPPWKEVQDKHLKN